MKNKLIPLLPLAGTFFFGCLSCVKENQHNSTNTPPSKNKHQCTVTTNPPKPFATSTYDAFPLLVETPDNKIELYYRQAKSHAGSNGAIVTRSSTDGGASFTNADTLLSKRGIDIRNVSGGITATGRIVLFVLEYNILTKTGIDQGYTYSDNDGKTWTAYQTISTNNHSFFSPYGKFIAIGNGKIMQSWYGSGGINKYSTYVITSDDNGKTWSSPITVATSKTIQYGEASYAYLDNNVIIGLVRNSAGGVFRQVISFDNGLTWSDQGVVTFDTGLMVSPSLSTYKGADGQKYVVAYYANRQNKNLYAVVGSSTALKSGVSGWMPSSLTIIGSNNLIDFGYPSVINPCETNHALGVYYKASSTSIANLNFFTFTASY